MCEIHVWMPIRHSATFRFHTRWRQQQHLYSCVSRQNSGDNFWPTPPPPTCPLLPLRGNLRSGLFAVYRASRSPRGATSGKLQQSRSTTNVPIRPSSLHPSGLSQLYTANRSQTHQRHSSSELARLLEVRSRSVRAVQAPANAHDAREYILRYI